MRSGSQRIASRRRIVVAGGALAGQSAVGELAALLPDSDIIWVTGETVQPYSKPALSKEFMQGRQQQDELSLPAIEETGNITRIDGVTCTALDLDAHTLQLSDGERIGFDRLIVCTGAIARMPEMLRGIAGVFPLRTLEDALAIRASLSGTGRVVVVGGGLIGCEFAASMRTMGLDVALVEQQEKLLERPFAGQFSDYLIELHGRNGVALHLGRAITQPIVRDGRIAGVELDDGTRIDAGLVVVGIGASPATEWLEGSGLELSDGIVCDAFLAGSHPHVYAAGDIARWHNGLYGCHMRVEHWTNASAQGRWAARNVAASLGEGEAKAFLDVPYFWSDQYGLKFQMAGWLAGHDRASLEQPDNAPGPVVHYYRGDRLVAVAAVNGPRIVMKARRQIEDAARAAMQPEPVS